MKSRLLRALGLPVLVCAGALSLVAAASAEAPSSTAKAATTASGATVKAARPGAVGVRTTSVMGGAWNSDNSPIPAAKLRLRNVLTGRMEATAVASDLGQFEFTGIEGGSYVIELVSDSGRIIAIGHAFTVEPGETVATFVRLPAKAPWFKGFFGNAASAIAAVAASTGVTAVAPEHMACASPPCSQ
jgi:hypothetical protein